MLKKRLLLLIPFTAMLIGCNPSSGEEPPAQEEKYDPIIHIIKQNEELALYDPNGGFVLTIRNQDYGDHFKYDLCVEDFSLGDYAQTFSDGVMNETDDKIVFNNIKVDKYSLFFPSTPATFTISHSLTTDDIKVTFNNSVFQLSKTEVSRKYYQNPVTFGKWDYQDKFMITTNRDSFEITEGDMLDSQTGSKNYKVEDKTNKSKPMSPYQKRIVTTQMEKKYQDYACQKYNIPDVSALTYDQAEYIINSLTKKGLLKDTIHEGESIDEERNYN